MLGIAGNGVGASKRSETWKAILRETIGARHFLIVLDDIWDYRDASLLKVGGLHCTYVATTRSPHTAIAFAMQGAIHIPELSEENGVLLLEHLAPEITIYDDKEQISAIVHSVGALPLALMLAGKYLHRQGYSGQKRRLHSAIQNLLDANQRLQLSEPIGVTGEYPSLSLGTSLSLQSLIAVSDYNLDESAQRTRRALSAFPSKPNTFSEDAALAISNAPIEVLDAFCDIGLLEINAKGRYALHQTIADYARSKQADERANKRFITYYVKYIKEHVTDYEKIERESGNILVMLESAYRRNMKTSLIQGICYFVHFLLARGLYDLAKTHLERAYSVLQTIEDISATIACQHYLGVVAHKQGEYLQATEYCEAGLALARKAAISEWICELLSDLGWVAAKRGLYDHAQIYAQEGLSQIDYVNDTHRCKLFTVLGVVADSKGEYLQAIEYYQEGLALARLNNDKEQQCVILNDLGVNASERGMWKEAFDFYQEVRLLAIQLKHFEWHCLSLLNLCAYYLVAKEYILASQYNNEALPLTKQLGQREWESFALITQGILALRGEKNYTQANVSLQEALVLASEIEKPQYICDALKFLGDLALECQKIEDAAHFYTQMKQDIPLGHQGLKAENLYRLGLVAAARHETLNAKNLGEEALAIFEMAGHRTTEEVRHWVAIGCPPSLPIAL